MATPNNIVVDPSMLKWARERAKLSVVELSQKLGGVNPGKIYEWEIDGALTLRQAEKVARATHVPFGYLYLDEPPVEELPISDFRTVGSKKVEDISLDLRDVIDIALARQEWYSEKLAEEGVEPLDYVGSLKGNEKVDVAATTIRTRFSLETANWTHVSKWEDAFRIQRELLEKAGVLVMRSGFASEGTDRPLDIEEFRGFALSDRRAPLIFINSKDYVAAQMFTMMHELIHIWLGESGISNLSKTYAVGKKIEKFCNSVAAEILVPAKELQARYKEVTDLSALMQHFKVSRLVMLRRLRDLNLMTVPDFEDKYFSTIQFFQKEKERKEQENKSKENNGPTYYTLKVSRLGKPFISALLEVTLSGRMAPTESFYLLGVKSFDQIRSLARVMGVKNA